MLPDASYRARQYYYAFTWQRGGVAYTPAEMMKLAARTKRAASVKEPRGQISIPRVAIPNQSEWPAQGRRYALYRGCG